jgi:uncharacterized protein involved in outer membrane biogenesis
MRKILLFLLLLVLLLPALALGGLTVLGLDRLRPWVEARATAALDRPVAIEGSLSLGWSAGPVLRVEGLRLAARPGERGDLARIGRLEARPALGRLLLGRLELDRLQLADATLTLPAGSERAGGGGSATSSVGEAPRLLPMAREVRLERVRLLVPVAQGRPPLGFLIAEAQARLPDPEGPLTLEARGELDGRPFSLRLGLDAPRALSERRRVRFEPLALELADSDLEGVLDLDPGGPRPRLEGKLASRRFELPHLLALLGRPAAGGEPGASEAKGEGAGPRSVRLIPDAPIELAGLREIEASLELRVAELVTGGPVLRELVLPVRIGSGRLLAEPVTAELAGGRIGGRLEADGGQPQPALALALEARGLATARLQRELGLEPTLDAPLDLDLELSGRGRSLRALLASAEGEITAALGGGRLRAVALDRLAGGVREAVRALAAQGGDGWVELRCGAFDLPIRAGVAELRVAVLETARARLSGEGRLDLGSERLDLTLLPRSRGATLSVAVPVRVRGTLAAPEIALDQREAGRRAALGLVGALVFPPAAIAAFADLGAAGNACLAPEPAPTEVRPGAPGTGLPGLDALRRGLESLFGGGRR